MSADPALSAQCVSRAEALARKLRADQAELDRAVGEQWRDGGELVSAVAGCLEKIAEFARSPGPTIISESRQPKA